MTANPSPGRPAPRLTPRDRNAILGSLGAGVVPKVGLHHIQVGRKEEVNALLSDLKRIEEGGAAIRFVAGRYGAGKSFFLNLVQTVALERRFVVVRADITTQRRLHSTGGEARSLYSELMRNLATRSRPDGGALPNMVERWVGEVAHQVTSNRGTDQDVARKLSELCQPLQDLVSGYDFATVIGLYHKGYLEHNEALQTAAIRWLRAEYANKTEARTELGVRSIIDDRSIYDYLKLFARFSKIAGYAGLVVCLDELVVLSHRLNNKIARNNNFEAILRILNDCLQGSVENLGFIFAATDDCVFDKRRGLHSYDALATRLAVNRFASDELIDLAGPVLTLKSLTPEDCYVLLLNVRKVHAGGDESKSPLPVDAIEFYLHNCQERMGAAYFQTPRETVKDFIGLLNILDQNPTADWRQLVGAIQTKPGAQQDPNEASAENDPDSDLASFKV